MILNNFKSLIKDALWKSDGTYPTGQIARFNDFKDINGVVASDGNWHFFSGAYTHTEPAYNFNNCRPILGETVNSSKVAGSGNGIRFGLLVGTGFTAATPNDYCLENEIDDTKVLLSSTLTNLETGALKPLFTIVNTDSSPITISEVGIFAHFHSSFDTFWNNKTYCNLLLTRQVLETPVTVLSGEAYTFSIDLLSTEHFMPMTAE